MSRIGERTDKILEDLVQFMEQRRLSRYEIQLLLKLVPLKRKLVWRSRTPERLLSAAGVMSAVSLYLHLEELERALKDQDTKGGTNIQI